LPTGFVDTDFIKIIEVFKLEIFTNISDCVQPLLLAKQWQTTSIIDTAAVTLVLSLRRLLAVATGLVMLRATINTARPLLLAIIITIILFSVQTGAYIINIATLVRLLTLKTVAVTVSINLLVGSVVLSQVSNTSSIFA
jgi:hypothetical protein